MITVTKDRNGKPLWCGPTKVVDRLCPWAMCFTPHDCGYVNSQGKWVREGRCVTNYNRGCPSDVCYYRCCDNPTFGKRGGARKRTCQNCGARVPVAVIQ